MKTPIELPESQNPRVPQPRAPFYHRVPLQLRFTDFDMLGHLNNGAYLTFMDLGKAHYFNDLAGERVDWEQINMAVVNINANFYAASFVDSQLEVVTAVVALSEHSLTMDQRVVDVRTGEVKCAATTIMAGYDVKTATSRPIDSFWREEITRWEERELPLHAPR